MKAIFQRYATAVGWAMGILCAMAGPGSAASLAAEMAMPALPAVTLYGKGNAPQTPKVSELPLKESVSQHGVTWTFEKKAPTGQFINGDWYVVGPVTVISIDPKPVYDGEVRNGSMLNPPAQLHCTAFDSRLPHKNWFRPNLVNKLPISMNPGDALMSAVSLVQPRNGKPPIKNFAVLTSLKEPAPADAFRPGYCDREQTLYLARNLRRDLLPRLPKVKDTPEIKDSEAVFQRPWYEGNFLEEAQAEYQQGGYGRAICEVGSRATLLLCMDFSPEEKERLLQNFIQYGLDLHGMIKAGLPGWPTLGGWGSGRKWPIVFAGLMLGDEKLAQVNKTYPKASFQEDNQTKYDDCWTGAGVVYAGHVGNDVLTDPRTPPGFGNFEHLHPSRWVTWIGTSYRGNMTSSTWIGQALAIRILNAEKEWSSDAWLDYCDRWMHETDPGYRNPGTGSTQGHGWVTFFETMWKAYREKLPAIAGRECPSRPPAGWKKERELKSVSLQLGKSREFRVKGQPFFPLMVFANLSKRIEDTLAIGANTVAEGSFEPTLSAQQAGLNPNRKFLDELAAKGLYGVFGADARAAGHPGLLGWIHLDEPDKILDFTPEARKQKGFPFLSYGILLQAVDCKSPEPEEAGKDPSQVLVGPAFRWMKKMDPSRPVFLTLGPAFFKAAAANKDSVTDYLKNCDVAGCKVPGAQLGEAVAKLRELAPDKPIFAWIETKGAKSEEVRAAVRTAISKGATAIGYRGFESLGDEKPDAAVMAELKRINDLITSHAQELLADPAKVESLLK